MKINFQNKAAKLKYYNRCSSCERCPFFMISDDCPWNTLTIVDCRDKGYWADGESLDIFKI